MKIAIAGSTGFIGEAVVAALVDRGDEPVRLVRGPGKHSEPVLQWDPNNGQLPSGTLEGIEAVICLSGESIAGRWTPDKKTRILNSRVSSASLLANELASMTQPPQVFVCASAVGYYGDRGDEILDETSAKGDGFLADVCEAWEAAVAPAANAGVRTVSIRWGVVLDPEGGMLKTIAPLFKAGLGGVISDGNQYMSWIALEDVVNIALFLLQAESLSGPVNGTAPEPVTNREFTKTLGRTLHRPTVLPVPAAAVKLAMGEAGQGLALASTRAIPARLQSAGFTFSKPNLAPALEAMFHRG